MPKKTHTAKKRKRKSNPRPDASQTALAAVEKLIGGKLADGMKR
jgi:hypothetical protein